MKTQKISVKALLAVMANDKATVSQKRDAEEILTDRLTKNMPVATAPIVNTTEASPITLKKDTRPVMERISSFADVCHDQGTTEAEFYANCQGLTDDEIAYRELKLITKCLNEGELDLKAYWYIPYFKRPDSSGFGFSYTNCDYWHTVTIVGSRLSFRTSALAEFAGKTFTDKYKNFMF